MINLSWTTLIMKWWSPTQSCPSSKLEPDDKIRNVATCKLHSLLLWMRLTWFGPANSNSLLFPASDQAVPKFSPIWVSTTWHMEINQLVVALLARTLGFQGLYGTILFAKNLYLGTKSLMVNSPLIPVYSWSGHMFGQYGWTKGGPHKCEFTEFYIKFALRTVLLIYI